MTYQEAIENLKYLISGDCTDNQMDFVEEIKMAITALEKQIPKKAHISLHGTTDWNTKCRCPACRKDVFGTQKYCGNCGQALDWGESE